MTNNLATTTGGRGLTAFAGGVNPFKQAADDAGVSSGKRLNFNGKTGGWSIGQSPVDDGTVLAFDLWNAKYVWTAWKSKKPVESRMYSIVNGEVPPNADQLPDHWIGGKKNSEGWQLGILVKVVDPDVGDELETTLKADNPWRPILKMLAEYGTKMKANMDEEGNFKIPLITIGTTSFETKDGDTVYAPTLELTDWISIAEMDTIREASETAAAGEYVEEVAAPAQTKAAPVTAGPKPALRVGKRV